MSLGEWVALVLACGAIVVAITALMGGDIDLAAMFEWVAGLFDNIEGVK